MSDTSAATEAKKEKKQPLFKKVPQFVTPDGKIFSTQKEASEHLRAHLVDEALLKVCGGNKEQADWLKANKDEIVKAYDAAKIQRPPVKPETIEKMRQARLKMMGKA